MLFASSKLRINHFPRPIDGRRADIFSMEHWLTDIIEWMTALPPIWAYSAILVISFGENVVPPIPGDMVVVFGGYLVGVGQLSFGPVIVLSTLGGVLGFMTMYAVGYKLGDALLDPNRFRWLPRDRVAKARIWIEKWGFGVVAANRFLSGLRSVISLTVGMAHMRPLTTAAFATLSAGLWTIIIALLGYFVGDHWAVVRGYLQTYAWVVTGLIALFLAFHIARLILRRRSK